MVEADGSGYPARWRTTMEHLEPSTHGDSRSFVLAPRVSDRSAIIGFPVQCDEITGQCEEIVALFYASPS